MVYLLYFILISTNSRDMDTSNLYGTQLSTADDCVAGTALRNSNSRIALEEHVNGIVQLLAKITVLLICSEPSLPVSIKIQKIGRTHIF